MAGFLSLPPAATSPRCCALASTSGNGGKHAGRLLSALSGADPSAADRLVRKFVLASSKSAALQTLSHFLSLSSPFALPIYERISETRWFKWSPKLAAGVVALLEGEGRAAEAETMVWESVSRLSSPREVAFFYCDLIEAFSERGLRRPAFASYARLREIPFSGRRLFEAMIKGLCLMGMPADAEEKVKEMALSGFRPSAFEFRLVLQSYGQLGLFAEMKRVIGIMLDAGLAVDTVCANVVLSCYSDHGELSEMVTWLQRMRESGIGLSLRTYNVVLNSCPTVVSMVRDARSLPLSIAALVKKVEEASSSLSEATLVRELVGSSLLVETLDWSPSEGKLDLHGFHVASAYVILLQWMEELRERLSEEKQPAPREISVVCGSGRHRKMGGESPVKMLVSDLMFRMDSSIRIDRKNGGRFVARGEAVRDWLCKCEVHSAI